MKKKAQTEIMGLLIIVILVVMVIFVVIGFKAKTQQVTIQKTYMNDQMSSSFLLALLDSSSNCPGSISLREVISDCATSKRIYCFGESSCDYLNNSLDSILTETLNLWGINYQFDMKHVSFLDYGNFTFSQGCAAGSNVQRESFQIIPLWPNPQDIKITLKICE